MSIKILFGFLQGFYGDSKGVNRDFYMISLGSRWESAGFPTELNGHFYKDSMGLSVRIRWGFNAIIYTCMSTRIQGYSAGIL